MNILELGHVDAEGGPLLIADAELGQLWDRVDGSDYERACDFFDSLPEKEGGSISIMHGHGLLWEMNGAGTAHIFSLQDQGFILLRSWPVDPDREDVAMLMAAEVPVDLTRLGDLHLSSGSLLILWATENGACVQAADLVEGGRPSGEMAFDTAGFIVKSKLTRFTCWYDQIENELGMARRCHVYRSTYDASTQPE